MGGLSLLNCIQRLPYFKMKVPMKDQMVIFQRNLVGLCLMVNEKHITWVKGLQQHIEIETFKSQNINVTVPHVCN